MSHFNYQQVTLNNGAKWEIAEALIDFNGELYAKSIAQSKKKSQHTMHASQAGKYRSPELKFQMQHMGILGEIYVQEYLKEIIAAANLSEQWKVVRYDDVRTDDFRSAANEYDLKIQTENTARQLTVESRSSIVHDRHFKTAIEHFDIIGSYSSIAKNAEELADFFIRPLYEFIPFATAKYFPGNFEKHLKKEEIKLYIVAGCARKDMIAKGYNGSMNQAGSLYRLLKIANGFDVKRLMPVLINKLN